MSFKTIRIVLLLVILGLVVHHQFNDRARIAEWDAPLFVAVYPINADGSDASRHHIQRLGQADFEPIARHARAEARRYGIAADRPLYIQLGREITDSPSPAPVGGNFLERAVWVARMRWWIWRFDNQGMDPDIVVLARYFDPTKSTTLPHSTGLEKVRVAIANLFASGSMQGQNRVVMLHEILHTVGATDKYDPANGLPRYPHGYARPERRPRYPQPAAEIMAGRIAESATSARQAEDLARTVVGPMTAAEIGWAK